MEICHSPLHLPPRDTRSTHVPDKLGKSAYGPRSLHVQILWISLVGGLRQCLTSNCLAIFGPSPQPAAALRAASRVSGVGFSFCRSLTERIPKRVEIHEICHLGPLRERREKTEILSKFVTHDSKLWSPRNFLWQPFETLGHPNVCRFN